MTMRLGEALIEQGLLDADQVEAVLEEQRTRNRPFGLLAEEMFGLSPICVEDAWAAQYASIAELVDPLRELIDPDALAVVDRRQAWQFRILPLRIEDGELRVATIQAHLTRAMRFTLRHVGQPCYFVLTTPDGLAAGLSTHFPMDGVDARTIESADLFTDLDAA